MPNHIGSLLFILIHSVRSGLVLILKHHARSLVDPLWSLRTSVAEHLRSRRRTLPCRDSSHTPRDASSRPVAHAPSSSTDHQLHFWDCRFVADPCTSTRLRTLIARAQALPRASLARLCLWFFVTWNRLPGFCITRISAAGDGDGSSLPGPRQLLVTAYSDLILVRRFMQGPIDSPSVIHTFIHGGSRPNHAARAPTATQMHLTRLASMRIRLAESRSALGQGSLFAAVSRRCQSAHLPSWGLSSVSRAARSGVLRCSSI